MLPRRVLRAGAVRDAGHDGDDLRQPPAHALPRGWNCWRCRSTRWSRCSATRRRHRGGHEVLRAGCARLRHAALRHVDDLRGHRHSRDHPHRRRWWPRARRDGLVLVFGLVFVVAGLGFKLGAVPFHMWVPDVYQGAPTAVTLFIGTAPKLAAFAFVMRLLGAGAGVAVLVEQWQQMLIVLAVLSMALGNMTAIAQTNLKRMLAYSTISHMGFMLLGRARGRRQRLQRGDVLRGGLRADEPGRLRDDAAARAHGFEAEKLDDFKGLNRRSPWFAFVMLLLMFSMAGIPPHGRLLREARGAAGGGTVGLRVAGGGRGAVLARRRLLLPAHRQAHVLRRADRTPRRSRRAPTCGCCSAPTASACSFRHPAPAR